MVLLHGTRLAIFTNKNTTEEISLHIKMEFTDTNFLVSVHCIIRIHFTQHPHMVFRVVADWHRLGMDFILPGKKTENMVFHFNAGPAVAYLGHAEYDPGTKLAGRKSDQDFV